MPQQVVSSSVFLAREEPVVGERELRSDPEE